jgi:hypothetical protein
LNLAVFGKFFCSSPLAAMELSLTLLSALNKSILTLGSKFFQITLSPSIIEAVQSLFSPYLPISIVLVAYVFPVLV